MPYVESSVRSREFVAAARRLMSRDGVAKASMRAVAAEAGTPLGTLQHVFSTKEQLIRAVIDDVMDEIADVLRDSAQVDRGLAHAIRHGITDFWDQLVESRIEVQVMQYELLNQMLRTPGQEDLARWQYQRYTDVVADWCREAAERAGETSALEYDQLARLLLATVDGLTMQYACAPDAERARRDLERTVEACVLLAGVG